MRFLIDECLSPKPTELAREKGYGESSHIVWLGLAGTKETPLHPGDKGQYARVDLHAGLICLNGPDGMTRDLQFELFEQALLELDADPDLVNQVLEITLEDERHLRVIRYGLPVEEG